MAEAKKAGYAIVRAENGDVHADVPGFPRITVVYATFHHKQHAAQHGIAQKLGDRMALGKGCTLADQYKAAKTLADHWAAGGGWNLAPGGGGGNTYEADLLIRAIAQFAGIPEPVAREQVKAMPAETVAALRVDPDIAPIIARLRDADAKARVAAIPDAAKAANDALTALRKLAPTSAPAPSGKPTKA